MATYYSSGTTTRVSFTTRFYLALDAPDPHYAGGIREFGIARTEGGGGNATRPLVGLLHPPDRRGNRAQAT